jgi:hypothetical protein
VKYNRDGLKVLEIDDLSGVGDENAPEESPWRESRSRYRVEQPDEVIGAWWLQVRLEKYLQAFREKMAGVMWIMPPIKECDLSEANNRKVSENIYWFEHMAFGE